VANETESRNDIAESLFAAMQEDKFVLHWQPIVSIDSQDEAWPLHEIFVRFKEEDDQLLPPGAFLPMLREVGLLPYLDRWVVNRLARHVRDSFRNDPQWNVPRFVVNLSDETLADRDFGNYVLQYADESYLSGGILGFDVSHLSAVAHRESLCKLMEDLRPHGCCLTVAGFDGNDSSWPELQAFEPEFVKINASGFDSEKVTDINRKCHELGAQTIAEYVEDGQMLDQLRRCHIDFAQGFGLAKVEPL
jgi:EAL domain-containing protein (putative c-di-GMP-specific phosphodiesterase class I)